MYEIEKNYLEKGIPIIFYIILILKESIIDFFDYRRYWKK